MSKRLIVNAATGAQRQKRYRANKAVGSIDLPEEVIARIRRLRDRTGMKTGALLASCLDAFDDLSRQVVSRQAITVKADGRTHPSKPRSALPSLNHVAGRQPSPGDEIAMKPKLRSKRRVGNAPTHGSKSNAHTSNSDHKGGTPKAGVSAAKAQRTKGSAPENQMDLFGMKGQKPTG
jgi:hypothetical protein